MSAEICGGMLPVSWLSLSDLQIYSEVQVGHLHWDRPSQLVGPEAPVKKKEGPLENGREAQKANIE